MLVIVENRNMAALDQLRFNLVALGRRNIFQIDAPKGRLQFFDDIHKFLGILGIDADGHRVHIPKLLVQNRLAFHNGHGSFRTNVPQPQHPGAIADDGHHVAPAGIFKGQIRIFLDFPARFSYPRRIGNGQVVPIFQRYLAAYFQLPMILGVHFSASAFKSSVLAIFLFLLRNLLDFCFYALLSRV